MTGSKDDQVLYLWHYHSQTEKKGGIYMIIAIISIAVLAAVIVSCVVAVVAGVIGSKSHDEDDAYTTTTSNILNCSFHKTSPSTDTVSTCHGINLPLFFIAVTAAF